MTVFRHIILIFILCFDIAVTAGTPADAKNSICNSIINIEVKSMCAYQADQSKYFDNNATNLCQSLTWDTDKYGCINAISNKAYNSQMIEKCARNFNASDILICLQTSGQYVY
jgi:hypothetical protein